MSRDFEYVVVCIALRIRCAMFGADVGFAAPRLDATPHYLTSQDAVDRMYNMIPQVTCSRSHPPGLLRNAVIIAPYPIQKRRN